MFKYFYQIAISYGLLIAITSNCIVTMQTNESLDNQNSSNLVIPKDKKVIIVIPYNLKEPEFGGCDYSLRSELGYSVIKRTFVELKKRNIPSSLVGISTNFTVFDVAEGIPVNEFSRTYYHPAYSEEVSRGGGVTSTIYHQSHSKTYAECKTVSETEYEKKHLSDASYKRKKPVNALINSNGQIAVKYVNMGEIPIAFDLTPYKENLVIKITKKEKLDYDDEWRFYLFFITLGLIPIQTDGSIITISMELDETKNTLARQIKTKHYLWLPAILTFGLLDNRKNEKIISNQENIAIQQLFDDLGFKTPLSAQTIKSELTPGTWSAYQGKKNWFYANEQCELLDMRLPTNAELEESYKAKITESWKKDGDWYWSSDRDSDLGGGLSLENGRFGKDNIYKLNHVRCIR